MAGTIHVNVVSAEESIFSGEAKFVALPGEAGELGIYPRHTPLITRIRPGAVRIETADGGEEFVFVAGGTVQAGGGVYLERAADREVLEHCRAGKFTYILTSRQMGKSSLMIRTAERLASEGTLPVIIDLTELGTAGRQLRLPGRARRERAAR